MRRKIAPDPDKPPVAYLAQALRIKLTDWVREQGAESRAGDLGAISLDATVYGFEDGMTLVSERAGIQQPLDREMSGTPGPSVIGRRLQQGRIL